MRIAVAVVAVVALLSGTGGASAGDQPAAADSSSWLDSIGEALCFPPFCRPRVAPELQTCPERCDSAYEACIARGHPSWPGPCATEIVRCKGECERSEPRPAAPASDRPLTHRECVEVCRSGYESCLGRESKRSSGCATANVQCVGRCPEAEPLPDLQRTTASSTRAETVPAKQASTTPPAVAAPAGSAARAEAPEYAAAPLAAPPATAAALPGNAPVPAPPPAAAAAPPETAPIAAPPPDTVSDVAPAAGASAAETRPRVTSEASATPVASVPAAPAPVPPSAPPPQRSFLSRTWCRLSPSSCRETGSAESPTCVEVCKDEYESCLRESRRGGECETRIMRCRQSCRQNP